MKGLPYLKASSYTNSLAWFIICLCLSIPFSLKTFIADTLLVLVFSSITSWKMTFFKKISLLAILSMSSIFRSSIIESLEFLHFIINVWFSSSGRSSNFKEPNQSLPKFNILESKRMRAHLKRFFFLRITPHRISSLKNLPARLHAISLADVFPFDGHGCILMFSVVFFFASTWGLNMLLVISLNWVIFLLRVVLWKKIKFQIFCEVLFISLFPSSLLKNIEV